MVGISLGDPSIGQLSESAMCTRKGYIRSETYRVTTAGIPCGMTCDPNYHARIELLVNPTGHGPSPPHACKKLANIASINQDRTVGVPAGKGAYPLPAYAATTCPTFPADRATKFMITRRCFWNRNFSSTLVKKSAMLSALATSRTRIMPR